MPNPSPTSPSGPKPSTDRTAPDRELPEFLRAPERVVPRFTKVNFHSPQVVGGQQFSYVENGERFKTSFQVDWALRCVWVRHQKVNGAVGIGCIPFENVAGMQCADEPAPPQDAPKEPAKS